MDFSLYINTISSYVSDMSDLTAMRVHVAPVGFEVDRVVIPVEQRRADRVWLLVQSGEDKAGDYLRMIRERLEGAGVAVQEKAHDRTDLFDIIRATREVIQRERENAVFVNLSSGSKIQAIGCMMACMMFNQEGNVRSYYVEPERYHQQNKQISTGVRRVMGMPRYDLQVPSEMLVRAMQIIGSRGSIRKKDLLDSLLGAGIMTIADDRGRTADPDTLVVNALEENRLVAGLARMEQNIIRPLSEWGFVAISKMGRNRWVSLTEEGKNAARFLPGKPGG